MTREWLATCKQTLSLPANYVLDWLAVRNCLHNQKNIIWQWKVISLHSLTVNWQQHFSEAWLMQQWKRHSPLYFCIEFHHYFMFERSLQLYIYTCIILTNPIHNSYTSRTQNRETRWNKEWVLHVTYNDLFDGSHSLHLQYLITCGYKQTGFKFVLISGPIPGLFIEQLMNWIHAS